VKAHRAAFGDWAPYLAGVGLVYLGCFLAGSGFSTVFGEKIVNGFFWGTLISVVFIPANFLIQFLVRRVFRRFFERSGKAGTLLLCAPAAAFVLKDVADPIPASVRIMDYGYSVSIASGTWGSLKFVIGEDDLNKLLKEKGYQSTDYDFGHIAQLTERKTALKVELKLPYEHYVLRGAGREQHIIFNTNSSTAYVLAGPGG